jgi:hypothetical protein
LHGIESWAQRAVGLIPGLNLGFGLRRRPWRESRHRRNAYDTMGSVTCLELRSSEKYHRHLACILFLIAEIYEPLRNQHPPSGFR